MYCSQFVNKFCTVNNLQLWSTLTGEFWVKLDMVDNCNYVYFLKLIIHCLYECICCCIILYI